MAYGFGLKEGNKKGKGLRVIDPSGRLLLLVGTSKIYPFSHFILSEEWSECAIRETLEETGLKIKNVSLATIVNAVVPKEDYHYITIFMKGEIDVSHIREPENLEPDKCDGKTNKCSSIVLVNYIDLH